ncbi:hypothetical protein F4806DRAFT_472651 [Annulohypoxylon nitens]|nr:hypothetical protein F4806DRAFT_472651 [Annulohypoxylon nitens]
MFLDNLNPKWMPFVTKMSLLHLRSVYLQQNAVEEFESARIPVSGRLGLAKLWRQLRSLPFLSELELDAIFLTEPKCVKVFRGPALKNLRQLKFTQSDPNILIDEEHEFVWQRRAFRWVNDDKFTRCIAKWIMGSRYGWDKRTKKIILDSNARGVEKQWSLYLNRIRVRLRGSDSTAIEDDEEYGQLPEGHKINDSGI